MNAKASVWNRVLWVLAGLGFLVGLYGLYDRLVYGHLHAAYGSYVPWGLWVAAYIWLVGASAGAFALAAALLIWRPAWLGLIRIALLAALAAFAGGMLSVWLDLGHPERLFRLYTSTNFFSMMGLMAWFYLLYGIVLLWMLWQAWKRPDHPWLRRLAYLAVPYAIIFAGAEGALFGVVGARPMWESGLTPLLFLVEAGLMGVGLTLVAGFITGNLNEEATQVLARVLFAFLLAQALFEWAEFSTGLYAGIPAKARALRTVLFGPFWWVFWIVHLGLGLVLPLLLLYFRGRDRGLTVLAGALVVVTGLSTKLNLVIPALVQEELEGLSRAFSGPGLEFHYVPTAMEWLLFIWTVSLAALLFLVGYNVVLPKLVGEVK